MVELYACSRLPAVEITVVPKLHQGTHRKTGSIRFPAPAPVRLAPSGPTNDVQSGGDFGYFFRKK